MCVPLREPTGQRRVLYSTTALALAANAAALAEKCGRLPWENVTSPDMQTVYNLWDTIRAAQKLREEVDKLLDECSRLIDTELDHRVGE